MGEWGLIPWGESTTAPPSVAQRASLAAAMSVHLPCHGRLPPLPWQAWPWTSASPVVLVAAPAGRTSLCPLLRQSSTVVPPSVVWASFPSRSGALPSRAAAFLRRADEIYMHRWGSKV